MGGTAGVLARSRQQPKPFACIVPRARSAERNGAPQHGHVSGLTRYHRVALVVISRTWCGGAGGRQHGRHGWGWRAVDSSPIQLHALHHSIGLAHEQARERGHAPRVAAHGREDLAQLPMELCSDLKGVPYVANGKVQPVCGQLQLLVHLQNERCVQSTSTWKTCACATCRGISIHTHRTQNTSEQQRQRVWSAQICGQLSLSAQRAEKATRASKLARDELVVRRQGSARRREPALQREDVVVSHERATWCTRTRASERHGFFKI